MKSRVEISYATASREFGRLADPTRVTDGVGATKPSLVCVSHSCVGDCGCVLVRPWQDLDPATRNFHKIPICYTSKCDRNNAMHIK